MPHGHEDWGINTEATSPVSTDNNELAVRLGSDFRIADTGHVFYDTNFVDDLSLWRITKTGTGLRVSLDKRKGVFKRGCLLINGTQAVDASATLVKRFPLVSNNKWGLELIIWFDTNNVQFQAKVTIADGANERVYGFEVNSNDDDVKMLDSDATFDQITTLTITPVSTDDKWIYVKMIFSETLQDYDKLVVNANEITVIPDNPDINVNADLPHVKITLFVDNTGATTYKFRIGSCVLTVDEP